MSWTLMMAVVGETEVGRKDRSLCEKEGEDWKASERFVRRSGSHLSVLPPTLSSPNSPECDLHSFPSSLILNLGLDNSILLLSLRQPISSAWISGENHWADFATRKVLALPHL